MPDQHSFDPNEPAVQILLLAQRVENLGKEKEAIENDLDCERADRKASELELEKRIAKMEKSFQRGAGILMVLPIIGTAVGLIVAYGKVIFRPWTGTP